MLHTCAWATLAWHGSAHTNMARAAQKRTKESMKGGCSAWASAARSLNALCRAMAKHKADILCHSA